VRLLTLSFNSSSTIPSKEYEIEFRKSDNTRGEADQKDNVIPASAIINEITAE
jgi:hypothetical protein